MADVPGAHGGILCVEDAPGGVAPRIHRRFGITLVRSPALEVREQLAGLQRMVWEALGMCRAMPEGKRYTSSQIIAAHLYAYHVKPSRR